MIEKTCGKRVLLLIDTLRQGGAERQLSALAANLTRRGHQVRLVKFYPGENFYAADIASEGLTAETFEEGKSALGRIRTIAKLAKSWKPDMVISYSNGTNMAACLAKLLTRFNLTVSERNTTQSLSWRERVKFRIYRLADKVVPNSQSQGDFIRKHAPWLREKTVVIHNVIDSEKFHPAERPAKNEVPMVLTTARVTPQKNVLNYLEAIAILRDRGVKAVFKWYGRVEGDVFPKAVLAKRKELELEDIVEFPGSAKNVDELYRNCDLFCLPSSYEGFPNVLCEAMASGMVCVASEVCDNPYILTVAKRLFDPQSPQAIAYAIEKALSIREEHMVKEGKANRERILYLCSPETFVKKYEGIM